MDWHRFFTLILEDFFTGSPFRVEPEVDLSKKLQLLDVAVIRKGEGEFVGQLPDGFDDLVEHNLVTFKSYQEALDDWALDELLGHFVNYRKQVSPSFNDLLPVSMFRLYGVCARFPAGLDSRVTLTPVRDGVYEVVWGTRAIRIIVINDLPLAEQNSVFQFFSAVPSQVQYAQGHYRQRNSETSSLLRQLIHRYSEEGIPVPYTLADFKRDLRKEIVNELTAEELREDLSPEQLAQLLSPQQVANPIVAEEILKTLPIEDVLKSLPVEEIEKHLAKTRSIEEILQSLPVEEIEKYLAKIRSRPEN